MESDGKQSLFQVFLRLRPPHQLNPEKASQEPWLLVEPPTDGADQNVQSRPTHITLQPPNDSRKRAVERFGFTKVFEEHSTQLDLFEGAGTTQILEGVLRNGRDGLVATLGVTGSGKSHTILGSRSQRGLTQMSLDVVFRSIGSKIRRVDHPELPTDYNLLASLQACDPSEATLSSASAFLDTVYGDSGRYSRAQTPMAGGFSRAQTPMTVRNPFIILPGSFPPSSRDDSSELSYPKISPRSEAVVGKPVVSREVITPTIRLLATSPKASEPKDFLPSKLPFWNRSSYVAPVARERCAKIHVQDAYISSTVRRQPPPRPSTLPQMPDVSCFAVDMDGDNEYAVIVSMYEVYNDRIFDLLSLPMNQNGPNSTTKQGSQLQKDLRRRALLFKPTETSPDRKVVAGLRKVVCGSYEEAMMVLETGLTERRVAGTGSNSVSSRSHGFFCIEVKKKAASKRTGGVGTWTGSTLSIVDLAGSERARSAKTTGSTLAEAGKINESLMYLGQCLQLQSGYQPDKPTIVPYRQCKLTELLFSNSFPSSSTQSSYRTPQRATMIVTADAHGDFNATSQILRYSALAREVTVPRVPSVTSQILSSGNGKRPFSPSGRSTPSFEEVEMALAEITRLSEENNALAVRLAVEEIKVAEMAMALRTAEDKAIAIEAEVREECWSEMETRIEEEKIRYRRAWEQEKLKGEEFLDGKIDILERGGIAIAEDDTATTSDDHLELVERENDALHARIEALERELQGRSPTRKSKAQPLGIRENTGSRGSTSLFRDIGMTVPSPVKKNHASPVRTSAKPSTDSNESGVLRLNLGDLSLDDIHDAVTRANVPTAKTPAMAKKQRKLTTRKWDLADENELFG